MQVGRYICPNLPKIPCNLPAAAFLTLLPRACPVRPPFPTVDPNLPIPLPFSLPLLPLLFSSAMQRRKSNH